MSAPALLEPPPPTATAPGLADLILLRLLPSAKSVGPADLRKDLAVFFRRELRADELTAALTALRAEGYVTPKGQRATDAGRARALQYLGIEKLPPRANWGTVKAKFLVPRAVGAVPEAVEKSEKLAALLLKRDCKLPAATGDTLNKVFEALVCQALGFPSHVELKALIPLLLARKMGTDAVPNKKDAAKVVPRVLLNASGGGVNGLRGVALRGWADAASGAPEPVAPIDPEPTDPAPFDLELFANTVKKAARACPTGRFGDNKVFISHVWEQLREERPFRELGLDGFKAKLIEANRERRLTLSRADLVQLMDPADVRASEISYLTATFHFILIEEN